MKFKRYFNNFFVSIIAFYIRTWDDLLLTLSILSIPGIVCLYFLPESPRYQLVSKKYSGVLKFMNKFLKHDSKVDISVVKKLRVETQKSTSSIADLFSHGKKMQTFFIISAFNWFVNSVTFYGIGLSAAAMPGSIYFSSFISQGN